MRPTRMAVVAALLLAGCAPIHPETAPANAAPTAGPEPVVTEIGLAWRPSREIHELTREAYQLFGERPVEVRSFTDARPDPRLVGRNLQHPPQEHLFVTRDDGAAWATRGALTTLQGAGVNAVPSGGELLVSGEIRKMLVVETDRYRASLVLTVTVWDAAGVPLYQREVVGLADNWGRSLADWNYHEALSDALVDAVAQVLRDDALRAALAARGRG